LIADLPLWFHRLHLARPLLSLDLVCPITLAPRRPPDLAPRSISSLNSFNLPPDLFSSSTPFQARPRRPLSFVSRSIDCRCIGTRKRVFICFSVSQPDRHNDARASPRKAHLIYAALSQVLRTASPTSRGRFCVIAAPLPASRCLVAALPSSAAASAIPVVPLTPLTLRDGIQLE
jgi:hypothetical protein